MKRLQLPGNLSTPFGRHHQQDVQVRARHDHDFRPQLHGDIRISR